MITFFKQFFNNISMWTIMNSTRNLLKYLSNGKCRSFLQSRSIHTPTIALLQRYMPEDYITNRNITSDLWFTNLPSRKKRARSLVNLKKAKHSKDLVRHSGSLLIDCKRKEFNHYTGTQYNKFQPIPLASKAWYHKKSKGDYFTILAVTQHPAFLVHIHERTPLTFQETGLSPEVVKAVQKLNAEFPTTVQAKSIPQILQGNCVLIAAETGCGKTLAYLAPILDNILVIKRFLPSKNNSPLAVIILPTRELAIQVGMVAHSLCSSLGLDSLTILGGETKKMLLYNPEKATDVLVCTIGAFSKLLTHEAYSMERCRHLVLDEADTLLDDSFNGKIRYIIHRSKLRFGAVDPRNVADKRSQISFVSATMPTSLDSILENIISKDGLVQITTNYLHKIQPHIPQTFMRVGQGSKHEDLLKIVKRNLDKNIPTMIFSNDTSTCNWLNHFLTENGIKSTRVNGKMAQEHRLQQFQAFREGHYNVICCTDIASRGLDCTRVKHVINFEFPRFMADYVHRCGRTGRIGHDDNCHITNFIASADDLPLVHKIEMAARKSIALENVNNNISRILKYKGASSQTV